MIETALVFDEEGATIHWHEPPGRSAGSLPDSRGLWEVLWEHRECLGGVAHTHPWRGRATPSMTDITTFRAVEQGLGKTLLWPVVTFDDVAWYAFDPQVERYVATEPAPLVLADLEELRARSGGGPAPPNVGSVRDDPVIRRAKERRVQ